MTNPADSPVDTADVGHPRRWMILGVLVVSLIVVVIDNTVLNVAMKTIADPVHGLGASQSELAWSINSYTLVFAGLLFAFGVLADRVGRKRLLLIGLLLFGISSALSAWSQSPTQLIWARAAMGVGAAAIMPSTLSIISNVFPPRERGRAIGVWAGAVGIGIAIGPIVGGALLEQFWWGSVFLINVPVVLLGLAAVIALVPESRDSIKRRLDVGGVLLSIAGLVVLTYGIIEGGDSGDWTTFSVLGGIGGGVLLLAGFVVYELRVDQPALDVRLFRERLFAGASSVIALVFLAAMGLMFFMTFYIQIVKDYSPIETGLVFLPFAVAMLIFAPRSAAMVKKYGPRAVAVAGMGAVTVAFIGYLMLDADTPIWITLTLFFIQGAGMANVMPPATETIMASLPREKAGVGSAVSNTMRQVGGSFGVAVLGSLMSQLYRDEFTAKLPAEVPGEASESIASTFGAVESGALPPEVMAPATDSFVYAMHWTALVAAVVGVIGVIVAAWLFPKKPAAPAPATSAEPRPSTVEPALAET